ncbi:MAG: DNA-3-methyladenine glycosylase [Bryobacteraceae bacterium]|nr:DNA-3-methyladenine glycosylase [Bryobacteraceae bacterium]
MAGAVILPRSFYARPAETVARDLLGKILVHGPAAGRIVEVEAYLGESDPAAHAFRGLTPRTRVLYGDPGHAYVYLIYGMYECLNLVAEPPGSPGCVLIRALEPLAGIAAMRKRRPQVHAVHQLASGPGKLTRAMAITRRHNGADLTAGLLRVEADGWCPPATAVSPRIGIRSAADWPLRFYVEGNPAVSRSRSVSD